MLTYSTIDRSIFPNRVLLNVTLDFSFQKIKFSTKTKVLASSHHSEELNLIFYSSSYNTCHVVIIHHLVNTKPKSRKYKREYNIRERLLFCTIYKLRHNILSYIYI